MNEIIKKVEVEIKKKFKGNEEIIKPYLASVFTNSSILLVSSHGKAKSLLADVTSQVLGLSVSRINGSAGLTESKYLARFNVAKLMQGIEQVDWSDFNYAKIKYVDEINRVHPTVLNGMFTMLAEKISVFGSNKLKLEPFIFIATMNPSDEGTFMMPAPMVDRFDICFPIKSTSVLTKNDTLGVEDVKVDNVCSEKEFNDITAQINKVTLERKFLIILSSYIRGLQICKHGDKEYLTNFPQCCEKCTYNKNVCALIDNRNPISDRTFKNIVKISKGLAFIEGLSTVNLNHIQESFKFVMYHRIELLATETKEYSSKGEIIEQILNKLNEKETSRGKAILTLTESIRTKNPSLLLSVDDYFHNDLVLEELKNDLESQGKLGKINYIDSLKNMSMQELEDTEQKITTGGLVINNTKEILEEISKLLQNFYTSIGSLYEGDFMRKCKEVSKFSKGFAEKINSRLEILKSGDQGIYLQGTGFAVKFTKSGTSIDYSFKAKDSLTAEKLKRILNA